MMNFIDRLQHEHRNMGAVLKCLEQQLDLFSRDGDLDYPLMLDVLRYIIFYPDRIHHPNEDILFAALNEKRPDLQKTVSLVSRDHGQLALLSKNLEQMVNAAARGSNVERPLLIDSGRAYLQLQFDHMRFEEDEIFPLAVRELSSADLQALENELTSEDDPIFSQTPNEDFALLHRSILQMHEASSTRPSD